jgi:hypothetical protein
MAQADRTRFLDRLIGPTLVERLENTVGAEIEFERFR